MVELKTANAQAKVLEINTIVISKLILHTDCQASWPKIGLDIMYSIRPILCELLSLNGCPKLNEPFYI